MSVRTAFGYAALLLGVLLGALVIYGQFAPAVPVKVKANGVIISDYHTRTIEPDAAVAQIAQLPKQSLTKRDLAYKLFELVSGSFIHRDNYEIEPWDNWVLWLKQQFGRPYLSTQDGQLLLKRGAGMCLQSSLAYVSAAQQLGLDAKVALLTGHVVAEVVVDGGRKVVADTDLGIFFDSALGDFGVVLSRQELIDRVRGRGFGVEEAARVADIFLSQQDNSLVDYPLSPKHLSAEHRAALASQLIPPLLVALGALLLRKPGKLALR